MEKFREEVRTWANDATKPAFEKLTIHQRENIVKKMLILSGGIFLGEAVSIAVGGVITAVTVAEIAGVTVIGASTVIGAVIALPIAALSGGAYMIVKSKWDREKTIKVVSQIFVSEILNSKKRIEEILKLKWSDLEESLKTAINARN